VPVTRMRDGPAIVAVNGNPQAPANGKPAPA